MDNYQKKLELIDQKLNYEPLHRQVKEINGIINRLEKKEPLIQQASPLGFLPDAFADLIAQVSPKYSKDAQAANELLNNFRSYLSRRFGLWSLANLATAQQIKDEFQVHSALEVMAGNAFWSKALHEVGVKVRATDSFSWAKSSQTGSSLFFPTENVSAAQAVEKYQQVDLILCCWAPNFGEGDLSILKSYRHLPDPKPHLLFIAEKDGATNTSAFWHEAEIVKSSQINRINRTFPNFDFINERFYEIK